MRRLSSQPRKRSNQAMQLTAPRSVSPLSLAITSNSQPRALSGAVADLVLVRPMLRYSFSAIVALAWIAFTGCTASHDTTDNVVRLPDGRPVAMLIPPSTQAQSANLPRIVGVVRAV